MLQFINDWNGNPENFNTNASENREYPINAWLPAGGGKRVFLVSAYVYDDFVMFLYIYDLSYHPEHGARNAFKMPLTQKDALEQAEAHRNLFGVSFEYEVNGLKSQRGAGGACLPSLVPDAVREAETDELAKMQLGEYDYLHNLVKDTGRIPNELKDGKLAFMKDCRSFEMPVGLIERINVYPPSHEFKRYFTNTSFKAPFGDCEIKVPYTTDGGEESYIIANKLEVYNLLDDFKANYESFKETLAASARENEENMIVFDEVKRHHDQEILLLSFAAPEENRSFELYAADYLESRITPNRGNSCIAFIMPLAEKLADNGLFMHKASLGKTTGAIKNEYEILLMSVTDSFQNDRKALLKWRL